MIKITSEKDVMRWSEEKGMYNDISNEVDEVSLSEIRIAKRTE